MSSQPFPGSRAQLIEWVSSVPLWIIAKEEGFFNVHDQEQIDKHPHHHRVFIAVVRLSERSTASESCTIDRDAVPRRGVCGLEGQALVEAARRAGQDDGGELPPPRTLPPDGARAARAVRVLPPGPARFPLGGAARRAVLPDARSRGRVQPGQARARAGDERALPDRA